MSKFNFIRKAAPVVPENPPEIELDAEDDAILANIWDNYDAIISDPQYAEWGSVGDFLSDQWWNFTERDMSDVLQWMPGWNPEMSNEEEASLVFDFYAENPELKAYIPEYIKPEMMRLLGNLK